MRQVTQTFRLRCWVFLVLLSAAGGSKAGAQSGSDGCGLLCGGGVGFCVSTELGHGRRRDWEPSNDGETQTVEDAG